MALQELSRQDLAKLRRDLQRFAAYQVRDPMTAEDLVQDALLAALGGNNHFEGRSKVRTWLTSILQHKITDHVRSRVRRRGVIEDEFEMAQSEPGGSPHGAPRVGDHPDWRSEPSRVLDSRQALEAVSRELQRIPPRNARAFVMSAVEGHEPDEICARLAVSSGNLDVILHRTRKSLRERLRPRSRGDAARNTAGIW